MLRPAPTEAMDSIPENLRELLRLLEDASRLEDETTTRRRLPNGQLVRMAYEQDSAYGFKSATVSLDTPQSEEAIIAALVVLRVGELHTDALYSAWRINKAWREELEADAFSADRLIEAWDSIPKATIRGLWDGFKLQTVETLLRQYRPDFDELPEKDQFYLIEGTVKRAGAFLKHLRMLVSFIEDGDPAEGNRRRRTEKVQEQVRAAELKDILRKTHSEIGMVVGPPPTESDKIHGGSRAAGKKANAGKEKLTHMLGADGYRQHVEQGMADADRWNSFSEQEKKAAFLSEWLDIPIEEARRLPTGSLPLGD
jgi:hypothetical protein